MDVLDRFGEATREWFRSAFPAPTDAQTGAWEAISKGRHALVVAPTGSGKTLSAFLWAIDRVFREHGEEDLGHARPQRTGRHGQAGGGRQGRAAQGEPGTGRARRASRDAERPQRTSRILYVSPLKALGVDVERNLRSPLVGIAQAAERLGVAAPTVSVGVRSGDTPPSERQRLIRSPPDVLITTPESLYLMLTGQARETLRGVHTVIVDEVHAVAATKRGAHLALSLERLDALLREQGTGTPAQRIGLSATVRPIDEVARFLGGSAPVEIVAPRAAKTFELRVTVPVDDMQNPPPATGAAPDGPEPGEDDWYRPPQQTELTGSIWPHVEEAIVDRILEQRSTIVFANSRRLAERLTARLNEIYAERLGEAPAAVPPAPPAAMMAQSRSASGAAPELAKAHHGSVSKEQRAQVEDELKSGALRCVVATSSLELGIDMGAVDLVIQVEAPPSAASGLQRVGRAGHQVGEISRAVLFPKHRADVLHTAIVTERMLSGRIEAIAVPQNPLDVLAQQTVAASALGGIEVEGWFETVRRSAPFRSLPRGAFEATLDLLAGRYPSDEFAELRPRLVWDRDAGTVEGRPGSQRLAVTSGGTIPDRGLFGVFVAGETRNARVGELDEEMVYESRVGDVFTLGTTSWRIVEITHDRVNVVPAFGQPGRVPFWHGDGLGRPAELGEALGAMTRELASSQKDKAAERLASAGLDERAVDNLLSHLAEQREATGTLPTDRSLTVERGKDEVGDWRIILHSPYGMHVHAPWALAVSARIRERLGVDGSAVASDDGIIARIPDAESDPPGAELFVFDPEELEQLVTDEVGGSALFASRFRECAARALLMPRTNPNRRSPLWQQRQRSAQLLEVAQRHPTFPIILETLREVLQDVYDLPALMRVTRGIQERRIRLVETETAQPSPYARDLLFGYVGAFMYEGDSPLAERRAAALSVDPALLSELLGRVEMRELLDPDVIAQYEAEQQRLAPDRRARGGEGVADLLRMLGPLSPAEVAARLRPSGPGADDEAVPDHDGVQAGIGAADGGASRQDAEHRGKTAPHADVATAQAHLDDLVAARRVIAVQAGGEQRFAAVEDAGRLRDALGVALPVGIPVAFLEPMEDPLGDLVSRYARTHGPFTTSAVARRLGIGTAVARHALQRLESHGRLTSGYFLPDGVSPASDGAVPDEAGGVRASGDPSGDGATASTPVDETEWCDAEALRRVRMRSLAALRGSVEPVAPEAYARFLPDWQHLVRPLEGIDGVLAVVEQLAGVPVPASAWETLVLPGRVRDYSPAMLDELTATGEVLWSGRGQLPGRDGWIALHPADTAPVTLPAPETAEGGEAGESPDGAVDPIAALDGRIVEILSYGGAYFAQQLAEMIREGMPEAEAATVSEKAVVDALWRLVWAGRVSNDTFSPIRALLSGGSQAHRAKRRTPRARTYRGTSLRQPAQRPLIGGRWSLLPSAEADAAVRAAASAGLLLDRYGVVTRGAVQSEGTPGGFAQAYRTLAGLEQAGHCRRGYLIEELGAAQFASSPTVDRLRRFSASAGTAATSAPGTAGPASPGQAPSGAPAHAITLAAADPANPYGAALPWPSLDGVKHRPGRKAGGLVVLVDGALVLYLERGGRTALVFADDEQRIATACRSLADTARERRLETLTVEQANGEFVYTSPLARPLRDAGFVESTKGLSLRRERA